MPPNPQDYAECLPVEYWIPPWTRVPDAEDIFQHVYWSLWETLLGDGLCDQEKGSSRSKTIAGC